MNDDRLRLIPTNEWEAKDEEDEDLLSLLSNLFGKVCRSLSRPTWKIFRKKI